MVMDWPTASVILGTMATAAGAVARFAPARAAKGNGSNGSKNGKGSSSGGESEHVVCLHGDKIAVLLSKFEGMDKKLDDFIAANKVTNDEQFDKINRNTQHVAAMNEILKIVQRKVLNGGDRS